MPATPRPRAFHALGRMMAPRFAHMGFPGMQVAGYGVSVGLTLMALWLAAANRMGTAGLVPLLLALALVQAGVQLASFMHVRESRGPAWHLPLLVIAAFVAAATVVFSMWIVTFKYGVS